MLLLPAQCSLSVCSSNLLLFFIASFSFLCQLSLDCAYLSLPTPRYSLPILYRFYHALFLFLPLIQANFFLGSEPNSRVSVEKAEEQRWRSRLQLCWGAAKRGLVRTPWNNIKALITQDSWHPVPHTYTQRFIDTLTHAQRSEDCHYRVEGESSAQTRLAGLAWLENKVCVLSMGSNASGLKVISHKHAHMYVQCDYARRCLYLLHSSHV